LIISHDKKFVLFAPWKTASSTVLLRLGSWDQSGLNKFYHFEPRLNRVVHQHMTCADFLALPEARLPYTRGAFVRNPYDRAYSGFLQVQRDYLDHPTVQFEDEWVRRLVLQQLVDNFTQVCAAGFDFNEWVLSLREEQVFEIGRNSSLPLHPAHYWTHVAGAKYVDFIGRTEGFERDLDAFLQLCDIEPGSDRRNENVSTADLSPSPGRDLSGLRKQGPEPFCNGLGQGVSSGLIQNRRGGRLGCRTLRQQAS
jgi:hypothetical protein